MAVVHQFLPLLSPGDGTGNAARAISARLDELGIDNDFFVAEDREGTALPYPEFTRHTGVDSVALYHLGTASPIADFLRERHEPLALYYHNVTPPEYFARMDASAVYVQNQARRQLRALCERTMLAMAPSHYNAAELGSVGYADVAYTPILFDVRDFAAPPAESVVAMLEHQRQAKKLTNWLYVGRLVPNKAQELLIMALDAHREAFGDTAVLHLVGRPGYLPYLRALRELVKMRDLERRVNFVLGATAPELAAFYGHSDVFISASHHEGFGMPFVEAFAHGLPIVAYGAAAIPETVGSGGVLLAQDDPLALGVAANLIGRDEAVRGGLISKGFGQLEALSPSRSVPLLDEALARLFAKCGIDPGRSVFGAPSKLVSQFDKLLEEMEPQIERKAAK